jgi:type I restriction enzyme R subunit
LFNALLATGGPEQKTIIFCVRDRHADDVATALNNLYAQLCRDNDRDPVDHFAFKCTAAGGKDYLAELKGASHSHYLACTVDLLTTGVDVPAVRNIVFFKYVNSPISFYQMVGRGTRIDPATGKLMFRVYDYTNATRLFGAEFLTKFARRAVREPGPEYEVEKPDAPAPIQVEGFKVQVSAAGRFILADENGREVLLTVEEYKERLAQQLIAQAATLDEFRARWVQADQRRELITRLLEAGLSPTLIRTVEEMADYDLYDVLGEVGYGLDARTRIERADAFTYKHAQWLAMLPTRTADTIKAIAAQFVYGGTEGLENRHIFQTPEVEKAGGLSALKAIGKPADVLSETKQRMFAV